MLQKIVGDVIFSGTMETIIIVTTRIRIKIIMATEKIESITIVTKGEEMVILEGMVQPTNSLIDREVRNKELIKELRDKLDESITQVWRIIIIIDLRMKLLLSNHMWGTSVIMVHLTKCLIQKVVIMFL